METKTKLSTKVLSGRCHHQCSFSFCWSKDWVMKKTFYHPLKNNNPKHNLLFLKQNHDVPILFWYPQGHRVGCEICSPDCCVQRGTWIAQSRDAQSQEIRVDHQDSETRHSAYQTTNSKGKKSNILDIKIFIIVLFIFL